MTTIFEALRADHDRQRKLASELVKTSGDSAYRRSVFDELKVELAAHADQEERYLYVPLMLDDLTQEKARHSVAEHKELDDLVEQLDGYDRSSSQWLIAAKELRHRLDHHLEEEEHEVFQLAGKVLTEDEKTELSVKYRRSMTAARDET